MFEELKPCPFCGGTAVVSAEHQGSQAWCKDCNVATPICISNSNESSMKRAVKMWNRRVKDD